MVRRRPPSDEVLAALDELCAALDENHAAAEAICARAEAIRAARSHGRSYSEIVAEAVPPLIPELLTEQFRRLATAGSQLRKAEARALHDEGMSMQRIAGHFGVTRQRVSALLAGTRDGGG